MEIRERKIDNTIAIAKGICIISVVLGHCLPMGTASNTMYQFHVALFFFVSGYFFSQKKVEEPVSFIKKRIIGLYFPYLKYAIFFLFIHNLLVLLHILPDYYDMHTWLYRLYLITTHFSGHDAMLGGFWFIKELFMVSILYLILRRYIAKSISMILPTLFVILCGAMVMGVYKIEVPWLQISQQTLLGIILFGLGELAHIRNVKEMYSVGLACSIVPLMLFSAYLGRYYFETTGTSVLIFMFLALSGIYVCLSFSNKIQFGGGKMSKFLSHVGQNTLAILGWHFLSFKLVSYIYLQVKGYPIERLVEFPGLNDCYTFLWPFHAMAGIFIPLLIAWSYEKLSKRIKIRK